MRLAPLLISDFKPYEDARGSFQKVFRSDHLEKFGFSGSFRESFFSFSKPGVLRGMHFQLPPFDHWKLVMCVKGKVLDVCVDLRKGPEYGSYSAFEMADGDGQSLLIPPGFAHGFCVLGDHEAGLLYLTSREHAPEFDSGIRWDSFGMRWPGGGKFLLSERDRQLPELSRFDSPWQL